MYVYVLDNQPNLERISKNIKILHRTRYPGNIISISTSAITILILNIQINKNSFRKCKHKLLSGITKLGFVFWRILSGLCRTDI